MAHRRAARSLFATCLSATCLFAVVAVPVARARKSVDAPHYLSPDGLDWAATLNPGPPAAGSAAAVADLAVVRHDQDVRTPADVARCRREDGLSPWLFADVLGPGFTHKACPATDRLLRAAEVDGLFFADTAKERWERPRPSKADPAVHPVVGKQLTGSYPSSHAVRAVVWAAILADLYPQQATALTALGQRIGDDRVVAGIHFPTDVAAGQQLGRALAAKLADNPAFKADLARARAETAAVVAAQRRPATGP